MIRPPRDDAPRARLRCAVCHDGADELVACPGCATRTHAECAAGLGRCPTLGCRQGARGNDDAPPDDVPPGHREAGALVAFLAAAAPLAAFAPVLPHDDAVAALLAGALAGTLAGRFLGEAVARRAGPLTPWLALAAVAVLVAAAARALGLFGLRI